MAKYYRSSPASIQSFVDDGPEFWSRAFHAWAREQSPPSTRPLNGGGQNDGISSVVVYAGFDLLRKLLKARMSYRNILIVAKCSHGSVGAERAALRREEQEAKGKLAEQRKSRESSKKRQSYSRRSRHQLARLLRRKSRRLEKKQG